MSRSKGKGGNPPLNSRDISSALVRPIKKKNTVYPLEPTHSHHPESEQPGDNLSLNLEEELARLELETLDDFVYNALGSFHIRNESNSVSSGSVNGRSNNNKYKVGSATHLNLELDRGNENTSRTDVDESGLGTELEEFSANPNNSNTTSSTINYRDSGISSETNDYPNILLLEQSLFSLESDPPPVSPERNVEEPALEPEMVQTEKPEPTPPLPPTIRKNMDKVPSQTHQQPNGSVGGQPGPSGATTSSHRHRFLPTDGSTHG